MREVSQKFDFVKSSASMLYASHDTRFAVKLVICVLVDHPSLLSELVYPTSIMSLNLFIWLLVWASLCTVCRLCV